MHNALFAFPAALSLLAKAAVFFYARHSATPTRVPRLFLFFLFMLAVMDIMEISIFMGHTDATPPPFLGEMYHVAGIVALALFIHLTLLLQAEPDRPVAPDPVTFVVYAIAIILATLEVGSTYLAQGYRVDDWVITVIPGPGHSICHLLVLAGTLYGTGLLLRGALRGASPTLRLRNKLIFIGILPICFVVVSVVVLYNVYDRAAGFSVTLPITTIWLTGWTAYAIHSHRLLDIDLCLPWNGTRKRKVAFYQQLRTFAEEAAELRSPAELLSRLAHTLNCQVALVGPTRPLVADAASRTLATVPMETLRTIEDVVVTRELAETRPAVFQALSRLDIGAVIPFNPHSRHAATWLLLGKGFSEQVYSKGDFRELDGFLRRISGVLLDRITGLRSQLADTTERLRSLETQNQTLRREMERIEKENLHLQNAVLEAERSGMEGGWPVGAVENEPPPASGKRRPKQPLDESGEHNLAVGGAVIRGSASPHVDLKRPLEEQVMEFERNLLKIALEQCEGNQSATARLLKVRPNTLHYKLARYGLIEKEFRPRSKTGQGEAKAWGEPGPGVREGAPGDAAAATVQDADSAVKGQGT